MPVPMQPIRKPGDYTVEFKTRVKPTATGPAILLVDNYGHICGVFARQEQADKAIPNIRKRIVAEYKRRDKLNTAKS